MAKKSKQLSDKEILSILEGDTDYGRQKSAIELALKNFATGQENDTNAYNTEANKAAYTLGLDPTTNKFDVFDKQRGYAQAAENARQNFAGRGLLRSSGYAAANAGIQRDFGNKLTDLSTDREQFTQKQKLDREAFTGEQENLKSQARDAAIKRWQEAKRAGMF